ncbi:putative cytochrome b5-like heme/steroid binding domain-containing protein [Medicago truncatula]|uniref:Membrane steroid-binding protein, putative n=1 Tax=Medicago truncatula TaxID=3880 RepID=G7KPJ4_MEDTR|nr:membrane steroid-binding protein, putative [Medicago truncatula]RHN50707.1 putative cytochrome b5-like heme/steroid binding domain-containing protein [Medicago truncatula]
MSFEQTTIFCKLQLTTLGDSSLYVMNFYGSGGLYAMFAGKECNLPLALLSFKPQDINGNLEGFHKSELTVLEDWEYKFIDKYSKVG